MSPKIKALLATGRTSNLPTVWSNILIAHLIILFGRKITNAPFLTTTDPALSTILTSLAFTCTAASLIYLGGCFLGDAIDANFDKQHKPDRPIPSGILSRPTIFIASLVMLALGSTLIPFSQLLDDTVGYWIFTSCLLLSIIFYSWLHKKSPWFSLPLIGACRFFLILFGAICAEAIIEASTSGVIWNSMISRPSFNRVEEMLLYTATAIGLYTICFASVARTESSKTPFSYRNTIALIMALLPLLFIAGFAVEANVNTWQEIKQLSSHLTEFITFPILIIAYINYWIWFTASLTKLKTNNKGAFVSMSLAGFCLLDATIAALFGWPYLLITLALFALALLLQKIAPAT